MAAFLSWQFNSHFAVYVQTIFDFTLADCENADEVRAGIGRVLREAHLALLCFRARLEFSDEEAARIKVGRETDRKWRTRLCWIVAPSQLRRQAPSDPGVSHCFFNLNLPLNSQRRAD